jgi:phage-related protein (TIGR01555 family)
MKGAVTSRRKPVPTQGPIITDSVLAFSSWPQRAPVQPFTVPEHPPGVVPSGRGMAMDDSLNGSLSWAASSLTGSMYLGADHFIGYPELALLAQRPEYRRVSETIATEMTRKWVRFQAVGDSDKTDKISKIEAAFERFHIRDIFREVAEQDGFFGRGHIYIDLGTTEDPDELKTPIGDGHDKVSAAKVGKGSLKGFKTVEAVWCYPMNYNARDPLGDDWYNPGSWFVMGKEIHASRLLTFIGREVPDLLKPAYSFGGLSLSQIVMPTVESWLRTKKSVEELIHSFSVSGIITNLTDQLNSNPDSATGLHRRVQLFNNLRDNKGLMVLNNQAGAEGEEFFNVSTPLGTLDHLQAQSQEHICSVSGLPLIKYTGITPSGLNASSEDEIRSFYDWVHSYQGLLFSSELTTVLGFIQLNEFGSVDPEITFEYEPLWSLDEKALAEKQKIEADTDQIHIATGVIAPSEARQRVAGDPDTPYAGLNLSDEPGAPDKKVEYGAKATTAVVEAFTAGLISHAQGLKELLESSKESGIFTTITPEDIKEAEAEPPPSEMEMMEAQAKLKMQPPDGGMPKPTGNGGED